MVSIRRSRRLTIGLLVLLFGLIFSPPALARGGITVYLDGREIFYDVPPLLVDNRTMVPVRVTCESLGANVLWQNGDIVICKAGNELKLTLGQNIAYKNGTALTELEVAPFISDNRTMVPLRFIAEAFGLRADYREGKVSLEWPVVGEKDKADFFALALAKRFDHLPEMTASRAPSLSEILMYTYFSLDNFKEYDTLTKSQVDEVAREQFGLANLNHQATKEWRLEDDVYTATGWSWSSACFYDLREINRYQEGTHNITEVLLKGYIFDEYSYLPIDFVPDFTETYSEPLMYVLDKKGTAIKEGLSVITAIRELIVAGDTEHFSPGESLRIKYYIDEASGNMVFTYVDISDNY